MRYLTIYIAILFFGTLSRAQVGVPPSINVQPSNTELSCSVENDVDSLILWFQNHGGMQVAGDAPLTIEATMTLDSMIMVYEASVETLCGNTKRVELQFIVTDNDGESTVSDLVSFGTYDNYPPTIVDQAQPVTLSCNEMARDSFVSWIKNHGNSSATDSCSAVEWKSFIWSDSSGNNGSSSIENGPYPPFLEECMFSFNITFIAQDSCNNKRGSRASFTIVDDVAPVFSGNFSDTTVLCHQQIPPITTIVSDACDSNPSVLYTEESTQSDDDASCNYYSYDIIRKWVAQDQCGNIDSVEQKIYVRDTIAPSIIGRDTVQIDCASYVSDSLYVGIQNACGRVDSSFQDSILVSNSCERRIRRDYTLVDVCSNTSTFSQILHISDTTAPQIVGTLKDTLISCETLENPENAFASWMAELGNIQLMDACSESTYFIAKQGSYIVGDTSTYPGQLPVYTDNKPCGSAGIGKISAQVVDVVRYDMCGNVAVSEVEFAIVDNTPPVIVECVQDILIQSTDNDCLSNVTIPKIDVMDSCSERFQQNDYSYFISINEGIETNINGDGTDVLRNIPQGEHILRYTIRDCSGNKTSCDFKLTIQDGLAPTIDCPAIIKDTIAENTCTKLVAVGEGLSVTDNCALGISYRQQHPLNPEDALFDFIISEGDTSILNKSFTFTATSPIVYGTIRPTLLLEVESMEGTSYTVFGENNEPLHTFTSSTSCQRETISVPLDISTYNMWAVDGQLGIAVAIEYVAGGACDSIRDGNDGKSALYATLVYSDAAVEYSVQGSTTQERKPLIKGDSILAQIGRSIITYYTQDNAGNIDSCQSVIELVDPIYPEAVCKNITQSVPPHLTSPYILSVSDIDGGSSDNCMIDTSYVVNNMIDCAMYRQDIESKLIVIDKAGNIDSCTARIKVVPTPFQPSYTAGVCQGDTLRMFTNPPPDSTGKTYTYRWTGPNFSSGLENPVITDASLSNNGLYTVTLTGEGGCQASASVSIMTSILTTPKIEVNNVSDTVCAGQQVILQTDTYTGDIQYEWFEGIFPDGLPMGRTEQPSLIIEPTAGVHNYYVVARTSTCSSNPSPILNITAVDPPIATITDPFINICEGENIRLSTSTLGNQYTYQWSGPNEYSSTKPIPTVIENARFVHQGTYGLIIKEGGCASEIATTKVNIFEKPKTPIISGEEIFCENSSFTLTVENVPEADKYMWYLNGTLFTITDENRLFMSNTNTNLQGDWEVTIESGKCVSDTSAIKQVTVNNLQNITASFTGNPCQGDTIQLLATFITQASYMWTGPEGFSSSLQNPRIPAIPGEYIVTATTPNLCSTSSSVNISTQEAPTITALSTDVENCMNPGDNISFFPSIVPSDADYNYLWNGPGGFVSTEKELKIEGIVDTTKNGTYSLTVYQGNCASNTFEVMVNYTMYPQKPLLKIEGNACKGDSFLITTTGSDGLRYLWDTPTGEKITPIPSFRIDDASDADDWKYALVTERNGCRSSASDILELDVVGEPMPIELTHNGPLCIGDTLFARGPDTYTYQWFQNGKFLSEENNIQIEKISSESLLQVSYSLTESYCTSQAYPLTGIDVYEQLPQPTLDETNYNICRGSDLSIDMCLGSGFLNNTTYTARNFLTNQDIGTWADSCLILNDFSQLQLGNNIIVVRADRNGCSSEDSPKINIRMSEIPDIRVATPDSIFYTCSDTVTVTSVYGPPEIIVGWKQSDEALRVVKESGNSAYLEGVKEGENHILLSYSRGACIDYDVDTVYIYRAFIPTALEDSYTTEVGKSITTDFLSNDTYPDRYTLDIVTQPRHGRIKVVNTDYIYIPDDGYAGNDTYTYRLCSPVCNSCVTAEVRIYVDDGNICSGVNVITPNGDNINDALIFPCLSDGTVRGRLSVFNQWGKEVYRSEDYQNNWQGTHEGNPLPVGTYYYILEANEGKSIIKDYITIQR